MKRIAILSACCLLLAVLLMIWGFAFQDRPVKAGRGGYSLLLVEEDTGSELFQISRGLREALQRQGGQSLRVERLSDHDLSAPSQLFENATALYLLAQSPQHWLEPLRALGRPLTLLKQAPAGERAVLSDHLAAGRLLGGLLAALPDGDLLIVVDQSDPAQALRLEGARAALAGRAHRLIAPEALSAQALSDASHVLCLSGDSLLEAASLLEGLRQPRPGLYGVEAVDQRVRLMEAGLVQAVAADSPYALGFVAGQGVEGQRLIPPRLVQQQDLYLSENVQLMFPLIN